MRFLSWNEFDKCIEKISLDCITRKPVGVYGIPRGGLCLAVALSHSLGIPLLDQPKRGSLVVDDIYDSGATLDPYRNILECIIYVWISKKDPVWWHSVEVDPSPQWLIFPWENKSKASEEEKLYKFSRISS